ncbi:DNA polymerase IV [Sulfurimonas sp. HSL-1716]|uniref:Y-family DNA polymerase n=1 Tax=Hydrocurvibacter sulfurireducens TaxID=3131937 RepID=UPI0031F98040
MKIHIDLDCFFVSAECTKDASLLHKPVAIGGRSDIQIFSHKNRNQNVNLTNSGSFVSTFYQEYDKRDDDLQNFLDKDGRVRGILTTASYEARKYGIKTAMSISEALRLCPHLIIKAPNMSLYQELSHKLHLYLQEKIPLVEQASIDEFYCDVTGWIADEDVPKFIDSLRHDIKKNLDLPVSIGASYTRYIAKLATGEAKPFGCKTIYKKDFDAFIDPIHVSRFSGIGKAMMRKLEEAQIFTLGELRRRRGTIESWGPYAKELYKKVNGETDTPISTKSVRKSIGISRSFDPVFDRTELKRRVVILSRHLIFAIQRLKVIPTVFSLSIRYELNQKSHSSITKRKELSEKEFKDLCLSLFMQTDNQKRLHIVHLAITSSEFTHICRRELSLLEMDDDNRQKELTKQAHKVREKYGLGSLRWGSEI